MSEPTMIRCPGCDATAAEDDLRSQVEHMKANHPEIVAERLAEAARHDGWEDE